MRDQASALRQIVDNLKKHREREPGTGARVICISSGKGGVGKTSLAVNMAISIAKKGLRVLLLDADFGLSNVDVMLGVTPPYDLSYVVRGQKHIRDIIAEGPGGVMVASGGSGMNDLINLSESQLANIMDHLLLLEDKADIIILDTGAGVGSLVRRMIEAASEAIIVTTPEPTAIMDSYALVKTVSPGAPQKKLRLVVNRADTVAEAEATMQKFLAVVRLYLHYEMDPLGYILADPAVSKGVRTQQPFVLSYPRSNATRNVETIAWKMIAPENIQTDTTRRSFFATLFRRNNDNQETESEDKDDSNTK